jgi:1,4-dihydroxy-2-naphthoate polyprenyltransferase
MKWKPYIAAWWKLSRIPFLSVGILPLILGFVLARRWGYQGPFRVYLLSSMGVILIMWMTYYLGEWRDLEGDRLNEGFNRFSGGSRVLVKGLLSNRIPLILGYGCLTGAILIVVYIYLQYRHDYWALFLGGIGIFSGFFYSGKPFRWAYRGVGEILIGLCYGWLPIATGFYLFAGFFGHQVFLLSIPVGLSIFNVILINEFPDEEADRAVGKRNLVVRFGKRRMGDLYLGLSMLIGLSLFKVMGMLAETPSWLLVLSGVPLLLILWNVHRVWKEGYRDPGILDLLCRNTLMVNLTITVVLTIQQTLVCINEGR